jgi:uncharacterized protein YbjT (DUF2867 family)
MLLGRRNESRPMESIAQAITKPLGFLFPSKFKPIRSEDVARAMVAVAKNPAPGFSLFHYREMMKLITPSRT